MHLPEEPELSDWSNAARLVARGEGVVADADQLATPAGWTVLSRVGATQMVAPENAAPSDVREVILTARDAPDIQRLMDRCGLHFSGPRVMACGPLFGIRHNEELIAMGDHRLRVPGWVNSPQHARRPISADAALAAP